MVGRDGGKMPQVAKPMSAKKVDALKAGAHAVGGSAGLYLVVAQSGGRSWLLRASVNGKRREFGLGSYPAVTLAEARTKALEARERISQGVDPIQHRRATQAEQEKGKTFGEVAEIVIKRKQAEAKNAKHAQQWRSTLETYCSSLWPLDVDAITIHDVLSVLEPIWGTKTETATRVRQRIERVLGTAIVNGWRQGGNVAAWDDCLKDSSLASPASLKKRRREQEKKDGHHPALQWEDAPAFMERLVSSDALAANILKFAILTAVRCSEARFATWEEINFDAGVWTIPRARMKMDKDHLVPLSDAAVTLLENTPRMMGTDLIFPGRSGAMSENTLNNLAKRLWSDYPITAHGFRSTFRDWAAERTNVEHHVAEMALAHTIKNAAEAAYRRGDLLEKRRPLMEQWAGFLEGTSPSAEAGA